MRPVIVGAGYAADGQRSLVLGPGSTMSSLVTPVLPPASAPSAVCSGGGGFGADGAAASEAFFFGGMSMKMIKI